jgi:lipid-A-disaccharide synthase
MKYYIIAGEASGDLHAANLMRSLQAADANATFRIVGGDKMKALPNTSLFKHISELSFMGFVEVLMNLRSIQRNLKACKEDVLQAQPDVLILVDFPGFNLRIAEYAKSIGLKVFYYISPKVWAWNTKRVHKIKAFVDEVFCILPFEKDFFAKYEMDVHYIGNPLCDAIADFVPQSDFLQKNNISKPILAILPGSRKMELQHIFPSMLAAAKNFPNYQVVIAGAGNLPLDYYKQFNIDNFRIVYNATYDVLHHAEIAMVTSGTATLETALFRVPQVVCYRANAISVMIARLVVKIKYISLVNLILDNAAVTELIQEDCNPDRITTELKKIEKNTEGRTQMEQQYAELAERVGKAGASDRAAVIMLSLLQKP